MLRIIYIIGNVMFLLILFKFNVIHGASVIERSGCSHNGTVFADHSLVPTIEPCLNCKCIKKQLICSLKVCPEMPVPPPRGCVLVHKKNGCCPYLSCSTYHTLYDGPNRRIVAYLDHFEQETIDRMVNDNFLQSRSDDSDWMDGSGEICVQNGTVYKSGSAMSSSSLCTYCYCIGGQQKCVKPKCMLAMEGCKPIFVDSTCCPVRYDCTTKPSGLVKSHQLTRSHNKHYLRMATRLQRSRGCIINSYFYPEGQKVPSEPNKLCDICFCIRGSRKCAPKKCAPALRNCLPVVPKGQCCPSSYDCENPNEFGRNYQSQGRQFDLFSLIFGSEQETNITEPEMASSLKNEVTIKPSGTTEKSFLDAIREGLEFIDTNESAVGDVLENIHIKNESSTESSKLDDKKEIEENFSLYDLLIGDETQISSESEKDIEKDSPANNNTNIEKDIIENHNKNDNLSLLDLIISKETPVPVESSESSFDQTTEEPKAEESSSEIEYSESTENSDYDVTYEDSTTTTMKSIDNDYEETTENVGTENSKEYIDSTTTQLPETTTKYDMTTVNLENENTSTKENEFIEDTSTEGVMETTTIITTIIPNDQEIDEPNTEILDENNESLSIQSESLVLEIPIVTNNTELSTENPQNSSEKDGDFLSAFLSGLSDIFKEDQNNTHGPINKRINATATTQRPEKSTILIDKLNITTRIDNNLDETEELPETNLNYSSTTERNIEVNLKLNLNVLTPSPLALEKPIIIKTNPSILEADYNFDYNEPTLPPSLPNLKIIPFLPADAVKSDRKQVVFDYYKINPTQYPSITEKHDTWSLGKVPKKSNNPKIDYDIYDHTSVYPSITENPTIYPVENTNHKKYGYSDYDYGEYDAHNSGHDKYLEDIKYIQNKYDFDTKLNGFSPPTKTEGGFIPKEPINDHFYYDNFHTTKFIVELTTATPKAKFSSTNLTVKPTSDPFKDVIKTESPPDLHSLIEDKEKFIANGIATNLYNRPNDVNHLTFEKDIISITTDASYNFTSEYKDANDIDIVQVQNLTLNRTGLADDPVYGEIQNINFSTTTQNPEIVSSSISTDSEKISSPLPSFNNMNQTTIETNQANNEDYDFSGGLESVLGFLFRDETKHNQNITIPPFKTLPTSGVSLNKSIENNHEHNDISMTTKEPVTILPISGNPPDLTILRDALIPTLNLLDSEKYKTSTQQDFKSEKPISENLNPFFSEPFNKLPFFKPSFPVKQPDLNQPLDNYHYNPLNSNLESNLSKKHSTNTESYQILPNDSLIPNTESYVINPVDIDKLKQHQSEGHAEISTKPDTTNSIRDPAGILKLAGCNIYGRMYRVGRIILELSGPCLECKCTEVGVNCTPLDC